MLAMKQQRAWGPREEPAVEYCGFDLHVKYSEVCIIDTEGEIVEQRSIRYQVSQGYVDGHADL